MFAKCEPKRMTFSEIYRCYDTFRTFVQIAKYKMNIGHKMHISCSNLYVDKIIENYHNV